MCPNNANAYAKSAPPAPPQYPLTAPHQLSNGGTPVQWSTGFITCFCPCITFGQVAEIVDKGTTSCAVAGLIFCALASVGCECLYTCTYRSKLRGLYSLQEDPCADFLVHCCCTSCAICQEYRELKNRGADPSIGWQGNVESWNRGGSTVPPVVVPGMAR
ncbi:hypothetical protein HHK36_006970 [Tetracentron sinense]|uniref:Uncharacterized protein n=1 Tax=Tetracentron sinense TaxID=13715 RepID=A0A834ZI43_TETSI|nr:hypothetical protein HHK36_006970 [Tetracentron sinense]